MLNINDYRLPEESTERVQQIKDDFIRTRAIMSIERAKLVTRAYQDNEQYPIIIKRAKALALVLEELPIFIGDNELIVGHPSSCKRGAEVFPERHMDWVYNIEDFETREHNSLLVSPNTKEELLKIYPFWQNRSIRHRMNAVRPKNVSDALNNGLIINPHQWNGLGHLAPDFELVLNEGLGSVLDRIKKQQVNQDMGDPGYYPKTCFLKSLEILINATETFANRYADMAEKLSKTARTERSAELLTIAKACRQVPMHPARNFYEALQSCWFMLLIPYLETNGFSVSLGRMDHYMMPFLETDLTDGNITIDCAQELLDMFFLKTCEVLRVDDSSFAWSSAGYSVGQNLVVGGLDKNGNDSTNIFSYLALNANKHVQMHQPNFTVRLHNSTPEEFLTAVVRSISGGNGMPQILNDEVIIPALLNKKLPLALAREYIPVGCDEITVKGQWGRCNGGYLNFAKVLEITLNQGKCMLTGKQIGLKTPAPGTFESYTQFKEALNAQFDNAVKLMINEANRTDWIHAELEPVPYLSLLTPGCIENGKDVTSGGAEYNSTGPIGIASANIADSLITIKKAVFENKRFSMDKLVEMLKSNFEGYELERQYIKNKLPKFGNDIDEVDDMVVEITNRWFDQLEKYRNPFGGSMWPALYSVSAQVAAGNITAASADGRLAALPLSDGLTPMYGCDIKGPTAALKSVAKVDVMRAPNGVIVNQRLNPSIFRSESGFEKMKALLRTFVELKSFHWQFNFISSDVLLAAQKSPDNYRSLVVRVAGYSAIFVDLSKKAQDSIIERTEASL